MRKLITESIDIKGEIYESLLQKMLRVVEQVNILHLVQSFKQFSMHSTTTYANYSDRLWYWVFFRCFKFSSIK
jgi:hypothetical protein